ncbi:MAG: AAA family ATPase [Pseudomonadota bacterium]
MPREISPTEARARLATAQRVLVFGVSGGGKSTLSASIERAYGLPHTSIDRDIRWLPGWQLRDRAEQRKLTEGFVAQDRWVIDGTTVSTFDLRVPRADLAIWVRVSRARALWQLTKRVWGSYGQVRPDMAEGCPEQLPDREFLHWIWTFEAKQGPRIQAALERYGPELSLVTLRAPSEFRELMDDRAP